MQSPTNDRTFMRARNTTSMCQMKCSDYYAKKMMNKKQQMFIQVINKTNVRTKQKNIYDIAQSKIKIVDATLHSNRPYFYCFIFLFFLLSLV